MAESHVISRMNKDMIALRKENKEMRARISLLEEELKKAEARAETVERADERDAMLMERYNKFSLTEKEMRLFHRLLCKPEGASRASLMNALYGGDGDREYFVEPKIIDVFMCKIRRKVTDNSGFSGHDLIKTVWGRGYTISPQLRPELERMIGFTPE